MTNLTTATPGVAVAPLTPRRVVVLLVDVQGRAWPVAYIGVSVHLHDFLKAARGELLKEQLDLPLIAE